MNKKPKEIDFDFTYNEDDLWDIEAPIENMDISKLEHNLDIAYLDREGTDEWNLTPRELINNLSTNPGHYEKIKNAQLKYPIIIYFFDDSWKILDGIHRLCKAVIENQKIIRVKKITKKI